MVELSGKGYWRGSAQRPQIGTQIVREAADGLAGTDGILAAEVIDGVEGVVQEVGLDLLDHNLHAAVRKLSLLFRKCFLLLRHVLCKERLQVDEQDHEARRRGHLRKTEAVNVHLGHKRSCRKQDVHDHRDERCSRDCLSFCDQHDEVAKFHP